MNDYLTLKRIQNDETKSNVRREIMDLIVKFSNQCKKSVNLLSLPSTEWPFEKGIKKEAGLIDTCKKHGIKVKMTGIENSSDPKVLRAFRNNAPKGATVIKGDFDNIAKKVLWSGGINVIWADYCGNPAEIGHISNTGKLRYSYPHVKMFRDAVIESDKPMLYFMTFSCNGRIKGGADMMMRALSPNASSIHTAIRHKFSQTISTYGLRKKAKIIMDIYYHGTGKAFMVTLGFAINFNPKFPTVKKNWVKKDIKVKAAKIVRVKIDRVTIKKDAIKALSDIGWDNEKIAYALSTQRTKVGSVLAWHNHRSSWQKISR